MIDSALTLAAEPDLVEFIIYCDHDDPTMNNFSASNSILLRGPKLSVSKMTNKCYSESVGNILMYAADDIIFRTLSWDAIVKKELTEKPASLIYGNDLGRPKQEIATHGFVNRELAILNGYLLPEVFAADFCDTWLTNVTRMAKCLKYVPSLEIEHMHPHWGKSDQDQTYENRRSDNNYWKLWLKYRLTFPLRLLSSIRIFRYNSRSKLSM
jgi:hypothetical protein